MPIGNPYLEQLDMTVRLRRDLDESEACGRALVRARALRGGAGARRRSRGAVGWGAEAMAMTDEQLDQAIGALQDFLARREAAANVIEGSAEPVALPAPAPTDEQLTRLSMRCAR